MLLVLQWITMMVINCAPNFGVKLLNDNNNNASINRECIHNLNSLLNPSGIHNASTKFNYVF